MRFTEFCCLWPRFVMNSWNDDGVTTVPWLYPEMLPHVRAAMRLRERLMPLIYTLMWQAAMTDEPAIRPLLWHWPEDETARNTDDLFMLGPDVIVAPALEEGATHRKVYLPEHPGGWVCFHEGTRLDGGVVHEVPAPLGRLPLFVRHGAVLPLADAGGRTVAVAFGKPAQDHCMIYEDDGLSTDWRSRKPHMLALDPAG